MRPPFICLLLMGALGGSLLAQTAPKTAAPKRSLSVTVTSSVTGPSVSLSCTESAGASVTSNNLYRGTASGGPYTLVGSAATCAFTDTTVLFATTYYYVATAVNGSSSCPSGQNCESPYSNQASAVIGTSPIPGAPSGLSVGTIVSTNVPLYWHSPAKQPGVTVASYSLFRCSSSNCPDPPKIATVTETMYTDSGCVPAKSAKSRTCYYEVRADDLIAGNSKISAFSNIAKGVVE
jgi:hypothetical protein